MERLAILAKLGYSARGIVYVLVGGMAVLAAIGMGGGNVEARSALDIILSQPLGRIWLGLVAVGLLSFVIWRLVQAVTNPDHQPASPKGYLIRAGMLISAATYIGLALYAGGHALSMPTGGEGGGGEQGLATWLMRQPFGRYLAGIAGFCILGAGAAQIVKAVKGGYRKYIALPPDHARKLDLVCAYGLAARGAIFLITGGFFLLAAFLVDPAQAGSLTDAMAWVRALPFGGVLYGIAALGLFAFGLYSFIEARYRRIPDMPDMTLQALRA
ncbi:hypothetical protein BJF93_18875 [Xaviernesmea oryzae]|uniref:DUF1206 domain-containing protein n=1 Tax=Xaviernesmea oryzae TaxID=464029 RepID=A0A1Q9B2P3_9HYPH|nr:DUF1206 domain-containing protein [Xaviernesmea oryzae]OLP62279.1 hypothetical protein BJF93_18875 [Xaviernesmea oryzae]SEL94363.1 protein of unknown function [Xaviernesmea oryzae]